MRVSIIFSTLVALLPVFVGATTGWAQTGQKQPWKVSCAAATREAPLNCLIEQEAVLASTGKALTKVTIRVPAETRKPVMTLKVPLLLFIPAGIGIDTDGTNAVTVPIETCDATGCYATTQVSDGLLQGMFAGNKLNVTLQTLDRKPVKVPMTLVGFTAAYKQIE